MKIPKLSTLYNIYIYIFQDFDLLEFNISLIDNLFNLAENTITNLVVLMSIMSQLHVLIGMILHQQHH